MGHWDIPSLHQQAFLCRVPGWCTPCRQPKPASARILFEPQTSFLTAATSPASAGASAPARAGAGCQTRALDPAEPELTPVTAASSLLSCKKPDESLVLSCSSALLACTARGIACHPLPRPHTTGASPLRRPRKHHPTELHKPSAAFLNTYRFLFYVLHPNVSIQFSLHNSN